MATLPGRGDFLFAYAVVFFPAGFLLAFSSGAGLVFLATSESARSSSLGLLPNPIQGDFSFGRGLGTKKVFLTRYIIDGPSVRTGLDEKR